MGGRVIIAGGGTGGHVYPALNIARALRARANEEDVDLEVLLIGARRGIEARIFAERGAAHELLPFEPIQRRRVWRNWRLVPSSLQSLAAVRRIFQRFDPGLVVGTGGYVAGPVVAWAALTRRRTAIQEQNSRPGLTTRWLAPRVDQLHLGYEGALAHLKPGRRTVVRAHGNPIHMPDSPPDPAEARRAFGLGEGRVLLVTGGSQGAASINSALSAALREAGAGRLPPLPADVWTLWATGPSNHEAVVRSLEGTAGMERVRAVPYIDRMEHALAIADLAVSRSGALALAELCAWGVPSVLVPYPHAAADHQTANARVLEGAGAARVLEDAAIRRDPGALWRSVHALLSYEPARAAMRRAARSRGRPEAADRIAEDLFELLGAAAGRGAGMA